MITFPTPNKSTTIGNLNMVSDDELEQTYQAKTVVVLDDGTPRAFDVKALQDGVNRNEERITIAEGTIKTHESDISAIKTKNTAQDTSINNLTTRITTAEGTIKTHTSDISGIKTKNTAQDTSITILTNRIAELEAKLVAKTSGGAVAYQGRIMGNLSKDIAKGLTIIFSDPDFLTSTKFEGSLSYATRNSGGPTNKWLALPLPDNKNFAFCDLTIIINLNGIIQITPSTSLVFPLLYINALQSDFTGNSNINLNSVISNSGTYGQQVTLRLSPLKNMETTNLFFEVSLTPYNAGLIKSNKFIIETHVTYYY